MEVLNLHRGGVNDRFLVDTSAPTSDPIQHPAVYPGNYLDGQSTHLLNREGILMTMLYIEYQNLSFRRR